MGAWYPSPGQSDPKCVGAERPFGAAPPAHRPVRNRGTAAGLSRGLNWRRERRQPERGEVKGERPLGGHGPVAGRFGSLSP